MFAPIEPFTSGHISVTDGHTIYWEASGNPHGQPALYLHGGPGGGIGAGYRRHFDPDRFLIVSFEQRGCGRSRPLAAESGADLASNTTQTLLADTEALRVHLGIESWLLLGVSWGCTLALAYAQAHPERVDGIVLAAVNTTTRFEIDWLTEHMQAIFPREWAQFERASGRKPGQRLIDAYYERILDPCPDVRAAAADAWCDWENVHVSLDPAFKPMPLFEDPESRLNFATLVIHYWKHTGFIADGAIQTGMSRLAGIPGVLIHGRYDVSSPMLTAWNLHQAWPGSEFIVIASEGHGGPEMFAEVERAIARIATLRPTKSVDTA